MSRDWGWFDDFKNGGDDAFSRSLAEETDRSLAKNPERQPWGAKVEDTVEQPDRIRPYRGGHGHHGRPGRGGTTERHTWSDAEYAKARRDYLGQNEPYLTQQERDELEDVREREEREWRDELFQTRHHHDGGGGAGPSGGGLLRADTHDDCGENKGWFW